MKDVACTPSRRRLPEIVQRLLMAVVRPLSGAEVEGYALPGVQRFKSPDCVARRQVDGCHQIFREIGTDGKKSQVRCAEPVPYLREKRVHPVSPAK